MMSRIIHVSSWVPSVMMITSSTLKGETSSRAISVVPIGRSCVTKITVFTVVVVVVVVEVVVVLVVVVAGIVVVVITVVVVGVVVVVLLVVVVALVVVVTVVLVAVVVVVVVVVILMMSLTNARSFLRKNLLSLLMIRRPLPKKRVPSAPCCANCGSSMMSRITRSSPIWASSWMTMWSPT